MILSISTYGARRAVYVPFGRVSHAEKALSRFSWGAMTLTDAVLDIVRRELRRISPEVRIETEEIRTVLKKNEVIKREVLEGEKAEEARRKIAKAAGKSLRTVLAKINPAIRKGVPLQQAFRRILLLSKQCRGLPQKHKIAARLQLAASALIGEIRPFIISFIAGRSVNRFLDIPSRFVFSRHRVFTRLILVAMRRPQLHTGTGHGRPST